MRPDAQQDILEEFLGSAEQAALFLDVDGTLVPIAETPEAVVVNERLLGTLFALDRALGGAVALVSGRAIADLDRLFAPARFPAAGLHGLERRDAAGQRHDDGDEAALESLRGPLAAFAADHPGVLLEDKGRAIALHYRKAPEAAAAARAQVERLVAPLHDHLAVVPGKMVFEIKPVSADKGVAVAAFMAEPPFAGRRPAFIGDDVTDEDGFKFVNDLGGVSVKVDEHLGDQPSAAVARLADVEAVGDWLRALLVATGATAAEAAPSAQERSA